jgi:hypothetical protein
MKVDEVDSDSEIDEAMTDFWKFYVEICRKYTWFQTNSVQVLRAIFVIFS